jgi:hypothetical protein
MDNRELCLPGDIAQAYTMPYVFNSLNAELNPICHLLALLEAHHILHVSRIRVKAQQAEHVGDYYGHHRIAHDSFNKRILNNIKNPSWCQWIFH